MRLSLDFNDGTNMIHAYQEGSVRVGQQEISASVLISARELRAWAPQQFDQLAPEHFAELAEQAPEIVILGTGARQQFPAPALLRPLLERGIGVEVMDTGAACRTYNIVVAEGRQVIAALLMI